MALRKKGLKVAVTAMAIISVITSGGLNNIYADGSIDKNTTVIERTLENRICKRWRNNNIWSWIPIFKRCIIRKYINRS